jgi:hypothetical protein
MMPKLKVITNRTFATDNGALDLATRIREIKIENEILRRQAVELTRQNEVLRITCQTQDQPAQGLG